MLTFTKKTMQFECYTSDITGDFEVILEGFTNLGERVYLKESFSVN